MRTGRARHCLALVAGALTLASGAAVVSAPAPALAGTPSAPIDLSQEPFSYTQPFVPSRWSVPALPSGTNAACLTASGSTAQTPVPGCGGTPDATGQGALRLTGAATAAEGGISSAFALPTADGLDFSFDTYQYGSGTSSPGDGLLFYLAATDPTSPSAVTSLGGSGGDLGYTSGGGASTGLTHAYLGVGLDVYGDFSSSSSDGSGCNDPSWATSVGNALTIRGPGEGTQGYCLMSSTAAYGGLRGSLSSAATTRQGAAVPVEVALNPTASATTTASGLTVPAYSYVVAVTPLASATQTISGSLPDDTYLPAGDSYWANASTGIPYQLLFGFAASTGAYDQVHEVSNLVVSPLTSTAPPVLSVAMSDNDAGLLAQGTAVDYQVSAAISASGGAEASAPSLVATLPSGFSLTSASGTNWNCSTYSLTAKCTWNGALPIAAGTNLSSVTLAGRVGASSSGTQTATAVTWEDGSVGASTTDVGTAYASASSNPALQLVLTDTAGGQLVQGATTSYVATALLSADGHLEQDPPSMSFSFPSNLTIGPVTAGSSWNCSSGSSTVSCTWQGGTIAAGTVLPQVSISTQVASNGWGGADVTASVSSTDAGTATASDWGRVASAPEFSVVWADSASGTLTAGSSVTYTATVNTAASAGTPSHDPVVTAVFPGPTASYFSAVSLDSSSTSWSCTSATPAIPYSPLTVVVETCTYSGTMPASAGTALQALEFDATVGSSANSGAVMDVSGSVDNAESGPTVGTDFGGVVTGPAPNFSLSASAVASAPGNYVLTATAGVLSTGGNMNHAATIAISLPSGESFPSTPSSTGWACSLSSSSLAKCTTQTASYTAGQSLPALGVTISPTGTGLHTVEVALTDSSDNAFETWSSATTAATVANLNLAVSENANVSAGSTYSLGLAPSLGPSGGQAYQQLSLSATLPSGEESISSVSPGTGWACNIGGSSSNVLTCTYSVSSSSPITPGTSLGMTTLQLAVAGNASGPLTGSAAFADSLDGASPADQTLQVTVTSQPALNLTASAVPAASAGSGFTMTLSASTGTAGGVAYNEPEVSLTLPSTESIPSAAPVASGWSCTVPGTGGAALTCTSTASTPIPANTSLGNISVTVTLISTASGVQQATALLTDAADDATPASKTVSVNATPPPVLSVSVSVAPPATSAGTTSTITVSPSITSNGPAYHEPQLSISLPSGETFATSPSGTAWICTLNGAATLATCTSQASLNVNAGSLGSISANLDISSSASGTETSTATLSDIQDAAITVTGSGSQTVTPPPVLSVRLTGTPTQARAGTSYTLTASASLSPSGGPAYHEPYVAVTLPTGETFTTPLPSEPGWSCSSSSSSFSCQSTDPAPIAAGNSLGSITATVDIASGATGALTTNASMTDTSDAATAGTTTATVTATAAPVLGFTTSGTPSSAQPGTTYQVTFNASVSASGGPTYNGLKMTVSLLSAEAFASAPTVPGWSCSLTYYSEILTCTTTSSSIAAGTSLTALTATVDISGSASGTLTTRATLSDTSDAATPITLTPAVDVVTPTTDPVIILPPTPPIVVVPPTTVATTTTTTMPNGGTTTTTAPGKGSTTTTAPGETTTTVVGGNGAIPPPGVKPPILELIASAPKSVAAGGKFVIKISTGLSPKGGAAYSSPSFSVDLPAGATWDAKSIGNADWMCVVSIQSSVLVCVWEGDMPLAPGSPMGIVDATVDVSPAATGTLVVPVTLSDTADFAKTVTTVLEIAILGPPHQPGKNAGGSKTPGRAGTGPRRAPPPTWGYRLVARRGGIFAYGAARFRGSCQTKTHPCGRHIAYITGIATAPRSGGYWLVSATGAVYSFGAHFAGSCPAVKSPCRKLHSAVVGLAPTPDGRGYWLAAANGSVFSFGDAKTFGSCTATPKLCPGKRDTVVGIAATPDGKGYWLATLDGEVFSFGDAPRKLTCTTSAEHCARLFGEIVAIAPSPRSKGYWLVNRKGRVFAFGSSHFWGDTYSIRKHRALPRYVVGIAPTGSGNGYWIASSAGYVMAVGGAGFAGDIGTGKIKKLNTPIVGLAST